jgi:hypothetical protein
MDLNLYIDNLPEYGFGSQSNYATSGGTHKGILMSTLELGFTLKWEKERFYAAMFLDSGYGTIIDQKQTNLLAITKSSVTDRKQTDCMVQTKTQYPTVAFGLTLGLNFK